MLDPGRAGLRFFALPRDSHRWPPIVRPVPAIHEAACSHSPRSAEHCQRPTTSKAFLMCSISGGRRSSGQMIAMMSNLLCVLSRPCRRKINSAAIVSRRSFSGVTASAGTPERRVFTSMNTRNSPSRDQIDLPPQRAVTSVKDAHPVSTQISGRDALAAFSKQSIPEARTMDVIVFGSQDEERRVQSSDGQVSDGKPAWF